MRHHYSGDGGAGVIQQNRLGVMGIWALISVLPHVYMLIDGL